jgi:hypothetical protein
MASYSERVPYSVEYIIGRYLGCYGCDLFTGLPHQN